MRFGLIALGAVLSTAAFGQTYVHGYTTKNGTYVAPHFRSTPDANPYNNWSVKPDVNPYTGQLGTKNPYAAPAPSYGQPHHPAPACILCSPPPTADPGTPY